MKLILALVLVLAPGLAMAQGTADRAKSSPVTTQLRAVNNQTAVSCSLCFTCGGDWPIFVGSFGVVGNNPTERGSACANPLSTRTDGRPFLCCR